MANILERAKSKLEEKGKNLTSLSYGEETELFERLAYETNFEGVTVSYQNRKRPRYRGLGELSPHCGFCDN